MKRFPFFMACLALLFFVGCSAEPDVLNELGESSSANKGKPAGGNTNQNSLIANVIQGDHTGSTSISSTCDVSVNNYNLISGHTQCLNITCHTWTSSNYPQYDLTDDVIVYTSRKKGKIVSVRVEGQDLIGTGGIYHSTDDVPVAIEASPDNNGFTLHVHATDIPLWRYDGHTGGNPVEIVGYIDIGDIVYAPAQ